MTRRLVRLWRLLRTLAGDDAYDRYSAHHAQFHGDEPMLDRRAFYLQGQREKWSGVQRCC
ncbi:MAG TPA: CstA-like transporter-associated (seleno)protein [Pseudomonadales bacterium]|jgi:uncharacterized short protein YbdD (DUF466 family)|nr:CstA-like transporter-associated (seleno)protein [Pseudomonadales bacterium]